MHDSNVHEAFYHNCEIHSPVSGVRVIGIKTKKALYLNCEIHDPSVRGLGPLGRAILPLT